MHQILAIFQIDSNKKEITFPGTGLNNVKFFGNGFFISKYGHIASVAHVLKNDSYNYYALIENKMHKISILLSEYNAKDENHIDAAIGRIDVGRICRYFRFNDFESIKIKEKLIVVGHFRSSSKNTKLIDKPSKQKFEAYCIDLAYKYGAVNSIRMENFFNIAFPNCRNTLSGCPIFNEQNNIVGIIKGGNGIDCQALHINIIKKMFYSNLQTNNYQLKK